MPKQQDEEEGDRRVAALLLQDARAKAELAREEGSGVYLDSRRAPRVSGRLLLAEVAQARSHNRRCGVDPAKLPPREQLYESEEQRAASVLDGEFTRRQQELRDGACQAASPPDDWQQDYDETLRAAARKRQRVGAAGAIVDVAAVQEEEARLAEEDVSLANPLLRPPQKEACVLRGNGKVLAASGGAVEVVVEKGAVKSHSEMPQPKPALWVSRKLRVRVVAEEGRFSGSHLKKGVVMKVCSARRTADVKLEGEMGQLLRNIPEDLLETVVSKTCQAVEVVRGEHSSLIAKLLQKDVARNSALLLLGGEEVRLALDDVCEFV